MRVPSLRPYDLPKTPPPSTVPLGFRVSTWLPRGHPSIPRIGTKLFLGYAWELHRVLLFATPWTVAHKASLSMECSRQEYWSGLLFSPPGDLPYPRTEPISCISCIFGRQILYTVTTTWGAIKSILALKKCTTMFKNKKSFIIPFSPSREIRFV